MQMPTPLSKSIDLSSCIWQCAADSYIQRSGVFAPIGNASTKWLLAAIADSVCAGQTL